MGIMRKLVFLLIVAIMTFASLAISQSAEARRLRHPVFTKKAVGNQQQVAKPTAKPSFKPMEQQVATVDPDANFDNPQVVKKDGNKFMWAMALKPAGTVFYIGDIPKFIAIMEQPLKLRIRAKSKNFSLATFMSQDYIVGRAVVLPNKQIPIFLVKTNTADTLELHVLAKVKLVDGRIVAAVISKNKKTAEVFSSDSGVSFGETQNFTVVMTAIERSRYLVKVTKNATPGKPELEISCHLNATGIVELSAEFLSADGNVYGDEYSFEVRRGAQSGAILSAEAGNGSNIMGTLMGKIALSPSWSLLAGGRVSWKEHMYRRSMVSPFFGVMAESTDDSISWYAHLLLGANMGKDLNFYAQKDQVNGVWAEIAAQLELLHGITVPMLMEFTGRTDFRNFLAEADVGLGFSQGDVRPYFGGGVQAERDVTGSLSADFKLGMWILISKYAEVFGGVMLKKETTNGPLQVNGVGSFQLQLGK